MNVFELSGYELEVPRVLHQFENMRPDFEGWLVARGAELLPPTNPYEVLRYKHRGFTNILYRKETGKLTYVGGVGYDIKEFVKGAELTYADKCSPPSRVKPDKPPRTRKRRIKNKNTRARRRLIDVLRERDGPSCWFCGTELGDDITKEHLRPRSKGGTNQHENLVLAHASCNQQAADKDLGPKFALRARLHRENGLLELLEPDDED